jgi:putative Ca2+/H+ antiporter (TMEM165/GDT1 family)
VFKKLKSLSEEIDVDAAKATARFIAMCLMGGVVGGLIIEFLPTWLILLSVFFVITAIVYRLEKIEAQNKKNDQEHKQ